MVVALDGVRLTMSSVESPTLRLKAAVLLGEQQYLERNIGDPGRYIPTFRGAKILSLEQCTSIKEQKCVEHQMQKFLELISMDKRGFTFFLRQLRHQKVHSHVATYLKKKVDEVDKKGEHG